MPRSEFINVTLLHLNADIVFVKVQEENTEFVGQLE